MVKKVRGYPLPPSDVYTEDVCAIAICIPDADWARRALASSMRYLATWVAYQRDANHMGKEAADSWKFALESMGGEDNMTCLDELIADVAAIRAQLELHKDCCDTSLTYGDPDSLETEIEPNVGDPPEYYGETAITDWDDWSEHVCYNAHKYVDYLKSAGQQLDVYVVAGGVFLGLISALLVLLTGGGLAIAVTALSAAGITAGIISSASALTFSSVSDDIEAARDDIVCALLLGYSVSDAVESALNSGAAWDLFYQFIDYSTATAIIYEGGYNGDYLPAETRDDCSCEFPYDDYGIWEFTTGVSCPMSWSHPGSTQIRCENDHIVMCIIVANLSRSMTMTLSSMISDLGLSVSDPVNIKRIEFDYMFEDNDPTYDFNSGDNMGVQVNTMEGGLQVVWQKNFGDPDTTPNVKYHAVITEADLGDIATERLAYIAPCLYAGAHKNALASYNLSFVYDEFEVWVNQG